MEHLRTVYHFTETKLIKSRKKNVAPVEKTRTARIEYSYIERPPHKNDDSRYWRFKHNLLIAHVYIDDELLHVFEELPNNISGDRPNYRHAHALIKRAETLNKSAQAKTRKVLVEKSKARKVVTRERRLAQV
jgi:hypothetical protein